MDEKLYFLEASKSEYTLTMLCGNVNEINARLVLNFFNQFGRNTLKFNSIASNRYRLKVIYKQALKASQANSEVQKFIIPETPMITDDSITTHPKSEIRFIHVGRERNYLEITIDSKNSDEDLLKEFLNIQGEN